MAWEDVVHFVADNFSQNPQAVLAMRVNGLLENLESHERLPALETLAGFMRASPWRDEFFGIFATSHSVAGQALTLALSLPEDFAQENRGRLLIELLASRQIPSRVQASVVARLVSNGELPFDIENLFDAFLNVRGATRRRRRLNRLNQLLGRPDFLTDRVRQAEAAILIACPRCQARLGKSAMIRHLLTKHGLVLEGKKVRNAWRVVDQWLGNYRQTGDKIWLRRCFDLVGQLEDPLGVRHLQQHMVLQRVAKHAMLRRLLISARANQAALCPYCLAQAPVQPSRYLEPALRSRGLLSRQGYRVHVRDDRPVPHLKVETPEDVIFDGHEPGHWMTGQGMVLVAALPLAVLAVAAAFLGAPATVVVVLLLLACSAFGWSWLREWLEPSCGDRAVDIAWNMLCPRLLARGPTPADADFLAALALASVGAGSAERRDYWLAQLRDERHKAFETGRATSIQLACLTRLAISDAASQQVDLASLTASALARCWQAQMPFSFAQQLLDDWRSALWTRGSMARLRVLLFDQAFAEGWEIRSLRQLREQAPALATVMELNDGRRAAELRWLWSIRAAMPWRNIGPSRSCFELAQDSTAERTLFEKHPDLLFLEEQIDGLVICSSGVYWRHLHFEETPRQIRITERVADERRSYTLHVGGESVPVRYDPAALVERLDRWLSFLREDFQTKAKQTRKWNPPDGSEFLHPGELGVCPECHQHFVGTAGHVGFKVTVDQ